MKEEGSTSANHNQMTAAREPFTAVIVRRWWLLAAVTAAQLCAAAALRVLPLARVRSIAGRWRRPSRWFVRDSSERVAWAIDATGRRLGSFSSCLARAVIAEMLLDPLNGPVIFSLGVRHAADGRFQAHAWIAQADRVLVGASTEDFVPIVTWTGGGE